ncbi:GNAT family N-acetyltransferase [Vibrio owensii]|uniref:GNAT family N-acetyltransferase n=1 Tax=Vibrio TaxID=662 RepID=UPI000CE423E9|nr:GNAT family N-acetyltransferase [Vibrio jasicida]CAH1539724.1 GNAT family N-acetyltransferase [Vibrio owensii]CAH1591380.1 GNAT family N-acetyltransferase [Vibrio owensii]
MEISAKNNEVFDFRLLEESDGEILGAFFEGLSKETRSKFGPHPLTHGYAVEKLCPSVGSDNVSRYIIGSKEKVVGYFIVDFNEYPDEKSRYASYDINLDCTKDPVLAPCIADHYQSLGIASQAMYLLIKRLNETGVNSLVLMGGTQEPNHLARSFYKKFGFEEQGEFYTGHNCLNNIDMRLVL